jgi:phosphoribosylamine--glycine ligase
LRILVVGNGGREHALLWKLRRDAPDAELFITRGNGGTGALAIAIPLDPSEANALSGWAEANAIDLTIVGPENALADGIADVFIRRGLPIFGPTKAAAAIESSKAYAKSLMVKAGVPTAAYCSFTHIEQAEAYIRERGAPIVVKASGLAAGKGAVVCDTVDEALSVARQMLTERAFGGAGYEIVIEECMAGEEISLLAMSDGENVVPLLPAQDHKRLGAGDTGPNTGGMGVYAPVSLVDESLLATITETILLPTLAALADARAPFRGLLYAGLMLTPDGPRVVEFNARFGDPETQVLLPLLESSLLEPMRAIAHGDSIAGARLDWRDAHALTTVLAAAGYPGTYEKDKPIAVPAEVTERDDVFVFHAGTTQKDGRLVTSGGRVMAVTGIGDTLSEAAARSREAAAAIEFGGKQFRSDIGWRELARHA